MKLPKNFRLCRPSSSVPHLYLTRLRKFREVCRKVHEKLVRIPHWSRSSVGCTAAAVRPPKPAGAFICGPYIKSHFVGDSCGPRCTLILIYFIIVIIEIRSGDTANSARNCTQRCGVCTMHVRARPAVSSAANGRASPVINLL